MISLGFAEATAVGASLEPRRSSGSWDVLADPHRLAAFRDTGLLSKLPELSLDRLTRLSAQFIGAEVALVTFVTEDRGVFASHHGLPEQVATAREVPLSHSLCKHVVQSGEELIISDAHGDARVCDNLAVRDMNVTAYAGIPIKLSDGRTLGSFCVLDTHVREWTPEELATLRDLAHFATSEIEARVRIVEKVQADRTAEVARRRFQATFEQAAVGIAHLDTAGKWMRVNRRMCEMLGYTRDALLEMDAHQLVHEYTAEDERLMGALLRSEIPSYQAEKPYVHCDGYDVWLMMTMSLVRDASGKPDYFIAVAEDISERRRAEASLRATESGLREAQSEVLERLAQAAELRDDETGQHTRRVGEISASIAAALGMSPRDVELIRQAAPLHDVGKIGLPDDILLKPGKLTQEERAIMEQHAAEGARILAGSRAPLTYTAELIAHSHHEKWDGSGYPMQLAGEAIPLVARIVAVADVFDALSNDRPYRKAWAHARVMEHITTESGIHFDPEVVNAFIRCESVIGRRGGPERDTQ